jgi:hypothetical protein
MSAFLNQKLGQKPGSTNTPMSDLHEARDPEREPQIDTVGWKRSHDPITRQTWSTPSRQQFWRLLHKNILRLACTTSWRHQRPRTDAWLDPKSARTGLISPI